MQIDQSLVELLMKYVLEKINEDLEEEIEIEDVRDELGKFITEELQDHYQLLKFVFSNLKKDLVANELKRVIIEELNYFQRDALLSKIEFLLIKLRKKEISQLKFENNLIIQ